jgi:hypothetical protein
MTRSTHEEFLSIVRQGRRSEKGMPNFADVLPEQDAKAIHGYIIHFSWQQYRCMLKWTGLEGPPASSKR